MRSCGLLAAAVLAVSLAACAPEPEPGPVSPPPTMAPEQSVDEACSLSRAEVDAMVEEAKTALEEAGQTLAAGEMPDLSTLSDTLGGALDRAGEGVINPEVLAALENVRAEIAGFGEIEAPGSLLEVPGYLGSLGTQLAELQTAGKELQQLCNAG